MRVYSFVEEEEDEKKSRHGLGKVCDGCSKRKDTKKVGKLFLCVTCRTKSTAKPAEKSVYENQFGCWCGNIAVVDTAPTCKECGKMICGLCGDFCKDHLGGKNA